MKVDAKKALLCMALVLLGLSVLFPEERKEDES